MFSDGFSNFIQFGLNLSNETHQRGPQFSLLDFLTPQRPPSTIQQNPGKTGLTSCGGLVNYVQLSTVNQPLLQRNY